MYFLNFASGGKMKIKIGKYEIHLDTNWFKNQEFDMIELEKWHSFNLHVNFFKKSKQNS